jgi:hypothetical protein
MKLVAVVLLAGCWTSSSPPPAPVNKPDPAPVNARPAGDGRLVQRTQSGGVIELSGNRATAMTGATEQMSAHCGENNFTVIQEGEEAVGKDTLGTGQVTITTAWRIHYVCNGPGEP